MAIPDNLGPPDDDPSRGEPSEGEPSQGEFSQGEPSQGDGAARASRSPRRSPPCLTCWTYAVLDVRGTGRMQCWTYAVLDVCAGNSEAVRHRLRQEKWPEELGVDESELPRPGEQARRIAARLEECAGALRNASGEVGDQPGLPPGK
jgi:hypothetical protein